MTSPKGNAIRFCTKLRVSLDQRAFTLLEVLLAMIILASGMLLITNTWGGNAARIAKARLNHNMAVLLEQKMVELELKYRDTPLDVPEEDSGDFGKNYPNYRWEMESKKLEFPDLSTLMKGKEEGSRNDEGSDMQETIIRATSNYLKQVAKEVRVTVFFATGGKKKSEIKHVLTTYFIDFNKEGTIEGLPTGGSGTGGGGASGTGTSGTGTTGTSGTGTGGSGTGGSGTGGGAGTGGAGAGSDN